MTKVVFDIESDGLLYTTERLWCIGIKVNDSPTVAYGLRVLSNCKGTLEEGLEILKSADVLIGHNIINFDLPAIKKLTGIDLWEDRDVEGVYDTLIASKLRYPNLPMIDSNNKRIPSKLKGKHGLKAWGYRLKNFKGTFGEQEEAWDKLTEEMVDYCIQDVDLTYDVYKRIMQKPIPKEAMNLEQEFARVIQRQEAYGWKFDVEKAQMLHVELLEEMEKATDKLFEVFKPLPTWKALTDLKQKTKKDGSNTQAYQNQLDKGAHFNDNLEWGHYVDVEFNPGSGAHIVRWVEELYGKQKWERNAPTETCPEGTPKTGADDIIRMFSDTEWAKPLCDYFNIKKLLGQLAEGKNAWLKLVKDDGRIHGYVDTLGAVSRRCTHRNPNVAQVPSPRAFKGRECRELFDVSKGKVLVGCDMSGLELRVFSHYLARYDNGEYANVILNEDIHTFNQKSAGLPTRDNAKTFIYGTLYGAGDEKVGQIVGKDAKEGKRLKKMFKTNVPAYAKLLEDVQNAVKNKGYLKALDGNRYFIRSPHSALNTLLQGAGALVCKQWLIETDRALQEAGYIPGVNYEFVSNVHDEFSNECDEDIAEDVARITEECCQKAGEFFNFRIKLEGEAKIGRNWYDVH